MEILGFYTHILTSQILTTSPDHDRWRMLEKMFDVKEGTFFFKQ